MAPLHYASKLLNEHLEIFRIKGKQAFFFQITVAMSEVWGIG